MHGSIGRQVLEASKVRAYARSKATFAAEEALAAAASQQGPGSCSSLPRIVQGLSKSTRQAIAAWLGLCSAWVASLVVLGGMTRLTRSGLSMTDWKFTGEAPPRSQEEWEQEFAKYQRSPEYKKLNRGMQLEDFKFIYWMEWAHRMWGRTLGLVFVVPAACFAARGAVKGPLAARLGLLGAMGATQGLVGWWMVRSGLREPDNQYETPRVSPYRLAGHLASAFVIYGTLLWTSLTLAFPQSAASVAEGAATSACAALKQHALPLSCLIALTAVSGAFVAGNDAGHAYNTFPLMNGEWVPDAYRERPGWRNMFESTAAVQLHHRMLALTTLAASAAVFALHRAAPLPRAPRLLLHGLAGMAGLQVCLGISALLTYVPASLGAAHQAGALTLLSFALGLLHTLRQQPASSLQSSGSLRSRAVALPTLAASGVLLGIAAAVTQMQ